MPGPTILSTIILSTIILSTTSHTDIVLDAPSAFNDAASIR